MRNRLGKFLIGQLNGSSGQTHTKSDKNKKIIEARKQTHNASTVLTPGLAFRTSNRGRMSQSKRSSNGAAT